MTACGVAAEQKFGRGYFTSTRRICSLPRRIEPAGLPRWGRTSRMLFANGL